MAARQATSNVAALCLLLAAVTCATGYVTYSSSAGAEGKYEQEQDTSRSLPFTAKEASLQLPAKSFQDDRFHSNQLRASVREPVTDEEKIDPDALDTESTRVRGGEKARSIDIRESIRTVFKTEAEEINALSAKHYDVLRKLQIALSSATGDKKTALEDHERKVRAAQDAELNAVMAKWRKQEAPKSFQTEAAESNFVAARHMDVLYQLQIAIAAAQGEQKIYLQKKELRVRAAHTVERDAMRKKWSRIRHRRARQEGKRRLFQSIFGTGGVIATFGSMKTAAGVCIERPSLQMNNVKLLARKAFGSKFTPRPPYCLRSNIIVSKESGPCCKRQQLSVFEKLYDTGVALMALGATSSEAFATFFHARALAWTLQGCEPALVTRKKMTIRRRKWQSPTIHTFGAKHTRSLLVIAFPQSYETLYDLYNSMLIERLRLRHKKIRFPTALAMNKLYYRLESRRNAATIKDLRFHMKPSNAQFFPQKRDLNDIATTGRLVANDGNEYDFIPSGRELNKNYFHVIEKASGKEWRVDEKVCDAHVQPYIYFIFPPGHDVRHRYEACCAAECHFLALYGRSFSGSATNCCTGCNRYTCSANGEDVVSFLGEESTVVTPTKPDCSPELISILV